MTNDPQEPHHSYALTPHTESGPTDAASETASTAHHEELLRTEALAARRGNLAIAKFAVIGLLAALVVGIVTWRSSIPNTGKADSHKVADASNDPTVNAGPAALSSEQPSRSSLQSPAPMPDNGIGASGGVVPLSEDPYLPPNAWNGGHRLHPTGTPQNPTETTDDPGPLFPPDLTGGTTGHHPGLPTIPGFPGFPIYPAEPREPSEASHPTEPAEPTEPTRPTGRTGRPETTNPSPLLSNRPNNSPATTESTQASDLSLR